MMTDEELAPMMKFYGVTLEQAKEMNRKCVEQANNPLDPICVGCARRPHEIDGYFYCAMESDDDEPTEAQIREYVITEEGTYNRVNGHFLCDACYIKNGQPSSERGWVCP